MKKQIVLIINTLCITTLFNLTGCGKNNVESNKENTLVTTTEQKKENINNPEEYIEKMYRGLINKEITYEDLWDDYISDISKNSGIEDKESFIDNSEANDFRNNIVRTNIKVLSSEQINDNIFKVTSILKYTINGEEQSSDLVEYVINENNNFKYIYNGIISKEEIGSTTIENINYNNVSVVNYVEGMGISMNLENKYDNAISLGWVDGSTIVLKTDKGEYSFTLNPIRIDGGQTQNVEVKFENVEGTMESIIINNINYLNNRGLPEDFTGGNTHTIEF